MLSRALISAPQSVQLERGLETDCRSGTRAATTLTKLPKARAGGNARAASARFTPVLSASGAPRLSRGERSSACYISRRELSEGEDVVVGIERREPRRRQVRERVVVEEAAAVELAREGTADLHCGGSAVPHDGVRRVGAVGVRRRRDVLPVSRGAASLRHVGLARPLSDERGTPVEIAQDPARDVDVVRPRRARARSSRRSGSGTRRHPRRGCSRR